MQRKRRVVLFDFDGTLADTWRDIASALNHTLTEAGLPPVEGPDVRYWIGAGVLPLLERTVPDARGDRALLDRLYGLFREEYDRRCLETTELYPGIDACLAELEGAALAVLSNKPAYFLDRIIGGLDLKRFFPVVVGGDSLSVRKPDPALVRHVLDRLGVEPDEVWMVGDSAIDVETGRAAGAHTIGCAWGLRGRDELRRAGVDHLIERADEIPALVYGRARA